MWRKRKWIIVAVAAATIVVAGGVTGGVVYAQSGSANTQASASNPGKELADRVAAILNLDPATVENAFAQAEKDMQDDTVKNYLDKLVQAGKMSQADADKYLQWWQSRPNTTPGLNGLPGLGCRGLPFKGGRRHFNGSEATPSPSASTSSN